MHVEKRRLTLVLEVEVPEDEITRQVGYLSAIARSTGESLARIGVPGDHAARINRSADALLAGSFLGIASERIALRAAKAARADEALGLSALALGDVAASPDSIHLTLTVTDHGPRRQEYPTPAPVSVEV